MSRSFVLFKCFILLKITLFSCFISGSVSANEHKNETLLSTVIKRECCDSDLRTCLYSFIKRNKTLTLDPAFWSNQTLNFIENKCANDFKYINDNLWRIRVLKLNDSNLEKIFIEGRPIINDRYILKGDKSISYSGGVTNIKSVNSRNGGELNIYGGYNRIEFDNNHYINNIILPYQISFNYLLTSKDKRSTANNLSRLYMDMSVKYNLPNSKGSFLSLGIEQTPYIKLLNLQDRGRVSTNENLKISVGNITKTKKYLFKNNLSVGPLTLNSKNDFKLNLNMKSSILFRIDKENGTSIGLDFGYSKTNYKKFTDNELRVGFKINFEN